MRQFDLEKARKIVADEQAKTLAAGSPIAFNDPTLNRALVREHASGKRERHKATGSSEAGQYPLGGARRNSAAG